MRRFLLVLLLAGCSGGAVKETHRGRLEEGDSAHPQDGSYYDFYTFDTKEGFSIVIEMSSDDFDSYLLLNAPNGEQLAQNDDVSEDDLNARIAITAPTDGTYTVFANSRSDGETGGYTLSIEAKAPTAQ